MASLDWDHRTISNGDAVVGYRSIGSGSTICLLPSTGRGAQDLVSLADELANHHYRVLLPEPRGIGMSIGSMHDLTFIDLAQDVAAVIEAEGGHVIVCGHAFGNWIARTLANIRPDLVSGVVLVAAGGMSWDSSLSKAIEMAMDTEQAREIRLQALQKAFFADGHDPAPWLGGWHVETFKMQRRAKQATNQQDWWPSGSAPILDLIARQDPFRNPSTHDDYLKEYGGRVQRVFLDNASHALPDERPRATAKAIHEWIEETHLSSS